MRFRFITAPLIAFVCLTMSRSSDAAPSIKMTAGGQVQKWTGHKPVSFSLDDSLDALGPLAKDAVKASLKTWLESGAKLPTVKVRTDGGEGTVNSSDKISRVLYAPITVPGHENDVAITITASIDGTGETVETDVILNSKYQFGVLDGPDTPSCNNRYDVQNVITHELGHAFGLGEDNDVMDATMYLRSAPCETQKHDLIDSDSAVLISVYGAGSPPALSEDTDPPPTPVVVPQPAKGCSASREAPSLKNGLPLLLLFALLSRRKTYKDKMARKTSACS